MKVSCQALADRSISAQKLNAQSTQELFNGVINNLRTQAESNRALAEDLIEQQRKQQAAAQALGQESVNAYTDFPNSMFSYYSGAAWTRPGEAPGSSGEETGVEPIRLGPPHGPGPRFLVYPLTQRPQGRSVHELRQR